MEFNETILNIGERQSGKTTDFIKKSYETGAHIIARNKINAMQLYRMAEDNNICSKSNLPFPIIKDGGRSTILFVHPNAKTSVVTGDFDVLVDEADTLFFEWFDFFYNSNTNFGVKYNLNIKEVNFCTERFSGVDMKVKPLSYHKLKQYASSPSLKNVECKIQGKRCDVNSHQNILNLAGIPEKEIRKILNNQLPIHVSIQIGAVYDDINQYYKLEPNFHITEMTSIVSASVLYDANKIPVGKAFINFDADDCTLVLTTTLPTINHYYLDGFVKVLYSKEIEGGSYL